MKRLLLALICLTLGATQIADAKSSGPGLVNGVGGVFIYAENTETLANWYAEKLGIGFQHDSDGHYFTMFPQADGNFTVLSFFPASTAKKVSDRRFVLNLRLNDLDATLKKLRAGGVKIEKEEDYDYGRFAWFSDAEGNEVEVWEPKR